MTPEELNKRSSRERERQAALKERIYCCTAAGCLSCGAESISRALKTATEDRGLTGEVEICGTGCLGLCSAGPMVRRASDGAHFGELTADEAPLLLESSDEATRALAAKRVDTDHPFFARQQRVVLENAGKVDPERLDDYLAVGGYQALAHAISELSPKEVIAEVRASGLRGRGGAGYPTGVKWELVAKQPGDIKYIVCNADEGDPGAFMDRSVLEGDPHRVLEGMALAGYALGAHQGYVYVRGEYTLAIQRLQKAIKQAEREGLLGPRVLDSAFRFRIDLRIGAGAFVCGEETALIASIEGKRGEPRPRPPYPPELGLWGKPTLINNVETFANVAPILREGSEWFAGIGTETSKGTKVFAVAGKSAKTGLVEVPMGTSLSTIVHEMADGVPGGEVKAIQTGGPSGGCIPNDLLEIPVDFESLAQVGSIMGSGGLIVMDDQTSMVDVARYFMEFCMDESCGKCLPCRAGTVQMHDILRRFSDGRARRADLALLEELSDLLKSASLCGLGQTAPNPVKSALRYFASEFEQRMQHEGRSEAAEVAEGAGS
jgi:bidirectional [NiFe] hydrogenase diaphorase subunit